MALSGFALPFTPKPSVKPPASPSKGVTGAASASGGKGKPVSGKAKVKVVTPAQGKANAAKQAGLSTGTGFQTLGHVATDIPKELQGKGVVASAVKSGASTVAKGTVSLADHAIANLAGHTIPMPESERRSVQSAVAKDLPKELTGKGAVDRLLSTGGSFVGSLSPKNNLGGIQQAGLGSGIPNLGKEAADLPAEFLPSSFNTASALYQLAKGNPKPIASEGKQIGQSLTSLKGWEQHPLSNALMVSGGLSAIARPTEALLTAVGKMDAPGVRAPEHLYGQVSSPLPPYSRDPIIRARQKAAEAFRTRGKFSLTDNTGRGQLTSRRTALLSSKRATEEEERNFALQQTNRNKVLRQRQEAINAPHTIANQARQAATHLKNPLEPLVTPEIAGKDAIPLIAERVIRTPGTALADIKLHGDQVVRDFAKIKNPTAEQTANFQATLQHLHGLLTNEAWIKDMGPSFKAANDFADQSHRELQPALVARGIMTHDQSVHAPLVAYARTHMGATHGTTAEALAHDAAKTTLSKAQSARDLAANALAKATTPAEQTSASLMLKVKQRALDHAQHAEQLLRVPDKMREATLGSDGKRLTTAEIQQHMKANGLPTHAAYITHKVVSDAQAAYSGLHEQALAEIHSRTGEAFATGQVDHTYHGLTNTHLMQQLKIDKHDTTAHLHLMFGMHNPLRDEGRGYWNDFGSAERAAVDPAVRAALKVPDHVELRPMYISPQFVGKNQLDAIKASIEEPITHSNQPITDALANHGAGKYMLIGKNVADRLIEHEARRGKFDKAMSAFTGQFVHTVLPVSVKRFFGLAQEQFLRLVASHTGPLSLVRQKQIQSQLESGKVPPELQPAAKMLAQEITLRALNGAQINSMRRVFRYNNPDDWKSVGGPAGAVLYGGAKGMQWARGKPFTGHIMNTWRTFSKGVLKDTARILEVPAQQAHVGDFWREEHARQIGSAMTRTVRLQEKAINDMLQGRLGTGDQVEHAQAVMNLANEIGRHVDRRVGRYGRNSPFERKVLGFAPFAMWFTQSLKFVYATLPHEHPIITGLQAAANVGTQQQRAKEGLSGPLAGNPNEVPGYEEGGVPFGSKIWAGQYYTPAGAVTDAPTTVATLFPLSSPLLNLGGANWKFATATAPGKPRGEPPGWFDQFLMAGNSVAQMIVPGYGQTQTIMQGGKAAYDTSTPFNIQTYRGAKGNPAAAALNLLKPVRLYNRKVSTSTGLGLPTPGSLGVSSSDLGVSKSQLGIP